MTDDPHSDRWSDRNPFVLVKSNDLDDAQIQRFWVDFGGKANVVGPSFFSPMSPMPTILVGGKGSGKTHLMRYHSFAVQSIRFGSAEDWTERLRNDRYLGIYTRAGGLQAERFQGRGIADDQWREVFAYYSELWYAQEMVAVLRRLRTHLPALRDREAAVARGLVGCFDDPPASTMPGGFDTLAEMLHAAQKDLDLGVNEAAFTRKLHPRIRASRGSLIFGFPQVIASEVHPVKDLLFTYYVDEYENLSIPQQKYINTLVREHQEPTTLRIGARAYGMRTYDTFSIDEPLKGGSEFDLLQLDAHFRSDRRAYNDFSRDVVKRRLEEYGRPLSRGALDSLFEHDGWRRLGLLDEDGLLARSGQYRSRPHFKRLREKLKGVLDPERTRTIVENLHSPESMILEKAALYMFFQAWAAEKDLVAASELIKRWLATSNRGDQKNPLKEKISHFRNEFVGQLLRDAKKPHTYAGLTTFITMSEGLPRALLTTLKHIFGWAAFRGEWQEGRPTISAETQRKGVLEASEWFLTDLRQGGPLGLEIQSAIKRLAELFRVNHLADKPVECSVIGFSVDMETLSARARNVLEEAEKRSFLVKIQAGERDRNSKRIREKFQLSRMLCPYYGLPISRRGTIRLDADAAEAIFDSQRNDEFAAVVKEWEQRVNAPFGRARRRRIRQTGTQPIDRLI